MKDKYYIEEIDYQTAMKIVIENHYLHRKCPCSHAFGLFDISTKEIKGGNNIRCSLFIYFT